MRGGREVNGESGWQRVCAGLLNQSLTRKIKKGGIDN